MLRRCVDYRVTGYRLEKVAVRTWEVSVSRSRVRVHRFGVRVNRMNGRLYRSEPGECSGPGDLQPRMCGADRGSEVAQAWREGRAGAGVRRRRLPREGGAWQPGK